MGEPSEEGIEDIAKDIMNILLPAKDGEVGPLDLAAMGDKAGPIDALINGKPNFDAGPREDGAGSSNPGTPKSVAGASSVGGGKEESLSDVDDEELELYL